MIHTDIKQQILDCITRLSGSASQSFTFGFSSVDDREAFTDQAKEFLTARSWGEAERYGRMLMRFTLRAHDKVQTLSPVIERLNIYELYGRYNFPEQRLHFCHQVNVFLLGLYIYHNFEPIRRALDLEMERTTQSVQHPELSEPFRYSGETTYGEFLYRWRIASLSHDIGTGIQLCEGDSSKISSCLRHISDAFNKRITSLEELQEVNNIDVFGELRDGCRAVDLSKYVSYHQAHPFPGAVHHDHGIYGALIFLRLMHEEYARHSHSPFSYTPSGRIFWHPISLATSIRQMAVAIAVHNLEKHLAALETSTDDIKIFNMTNQPLSWLLKIADTLQEWDKPVRTNETSNFLTTRLSLRFSESKISVENFPSDKRDQVLEMLEKFTEPGKIVSI